MFSILLGVDFMKTSTLAIIIIIFAAAFIIELIILSFAAKNPLHIHGNRKVLLTLFVDKDEYNRFKNAAISRGYNKIEPYIKELIEKDIADNIKE